jgi:hypothetical protein
MSWSFSRQHDHWKGARSRISSRASCSVGTEPSYASVGGSALGRQGAQGDIVVTLLPTLSLTLLDISKIHHRCPTYVAAASQTRGAAADLPKKHENRAHVGHRQPGHQYRQITQVDAMHMPFAN